jgi:hypothetical protein
VLSATAVFPVCQQLSGRPASHCSPPAAQHQHTNNCQRLVAALVAKHLAQRQPFCLQAGKKRKNAGKPGYDDAAPHAPSVLLLRLQKIPGWRLYITVTTDVLESSPILHQHVASTRTKRQWPSRETKGCSLSPNKAKT